MFENSNSHNMSAPESPRKNVGCIDEMFNYLSASADFFCRLLIIFASSLDPDQARHIVGPDLDPDCLTLRW